MRKRIISVVVSLAVAMGVVSAAVAPASAAVFMSFGWPKGTGAHTIIPVAATNDNPTWESGLASGRESWNHSQARVAFFVQSCSNTVTAMSYDWPEYGWSYFWYVKPTLLQFRIEMNARTISRDSTTAGGMIQGVFAHELGHQIWLGDNPGGAAGSSIMNVVNWNVIKTPTPTDVARVNTKY